MAENSIELSEIEKIKQRIAELDSQSDKYAQRSSNYSKQKLKQIQAEKVEQESLLAIEEERQELQKEQITFAKSFTKLNNDVKKILKDQNTETSIYQSIGDKIAKSKVKQQKLSGDELEIEIQRESYLSDINSSLLQQAQTVAKAEADAKGLTEFDLKRAEIKQNSLNFSKEELEELLASIDLLENIYKKEQRINSIKESQQSLYQSIPESLRSAVDFAKTLSDTLKTAGVGAVVFTLLAGLVAATVSSFTKLDESAKEFRETTGLTNSQIAGIKSDANEIVGQFGNLGIEAKNVFDTVSALKSEFSDIADFSKETTAALTVLGANFGVSAQNSAKVQGVLEQVSGLSSETAASVQLQLANMSKLAGVAPAKVFEDIAESAEISSTLFKGDTIALAKNAIEARRLGTNLKSVAAAAEKLLDFESGIEEELVAATFVGGQFNLSRARALAFEGKIVESQKEILAQVQRTGDFRQKDYFTQQQLAKAAGMSVEEINKQLNAQEKLSKLSTEERAKAEKAIEQGLDITNINAEQLAQETDRFAKQQEQQAVLEQVSNQFMGIVATLGAELVPLLQLALEPVLLMAEGLNSIIGFVKEYANILGPIAIGLGAIWTIQKGIVLWQRKEAVQRLINMKIASATAAISALSNPVLAISGIAAAALIVGAASRYMSTVGDMFSPAGGKTIVSTKEGGLFELSPNDDLIAAPGIASKMGSSGTTESSTILIGPLNALLGEIRGLRTDMNSGKIGVYMDTEKVTSKIGRQVDSSTRNNFNLGQA